MSVEPKAVADIIEEFVDDEHRGAGKWANRSPLDESGVFTLHRLAADIYTAGFKEGERTEAVRERGRRQRKSERIADKVDPS